MEESKQLPDNWEKVKQNIKEHFPNVYDFFFGPGYNDDWSLARDRKMREACFGDWGIERDRKMRKMLEERADLYQLERDIEKARKKGMTLDEYYESKKLFHKKKDKGRER